MADAIGKVYTSNVPNLTPFTITVGAPVNNVYNGTISGNYAEITIPDADLTGNVELPVSVDMSVNAVALPTYQLTIVPVENVVIWTLTPPAGSQLASNSQTFTIGPYDAGYLYGLWIGTSAGSPNTDYFDSGALTSNNVIQANNLPTSGQTLYVQTRVKRTPTGPTETAMFQLTAYSVPPGVGDVYINPGATVSIQPISSLTVGDIYWISALVADDAGVTVKGKGVTSFVSRMTVSADVQVVGGGNFLSMTANNTDVLVTNNDSPAHAVDYNVQTVSTASPTTPTIASGTYNAVAFSGSMDAGVPYILSAVITDTAGATNSQGHGVVAIVTKTDVDLHYQVIGGGNFLDATAESGQIRVHNLMAESHDVRSRFGKLISTAPVSDVIASGSTTNLFSTSTLLFGVQYIVSATIADGGTKEGLHVVSLVSRLGTGAEIQLLSGGNIATIVVNGTQIAVTNTDDVQHTFNSSWGPI